MNFWQVLITSLGGATVLFGIVGYLVRSLFAHLLDKDIEKFKLGLSHEYELGKIEHGITFASYYHRRVEAIAKLYELLARAHRDAQHFVTLFEFSGSPPKTQLYKKAWDSMHDFLVCLDDHLIYLPEDLCDELNKVADAIRTPVINFGSYLEPGGAEEKNEKVEAWIDAAKKVEDVVPPLMNRLVKRMREILGENQSSNATAETGTESY